MGRLLRLVTPTSLLFVAGKVLHSFRWLKTNSFWVQLLSLICAVGAGVAVWYLVPPERLPTTWWITDYLKIALYQAFLGTAWCSLGAFTLRFFPRIDCGTRERLLYAVTLGVIGFALFIYLAGALALLSPTFAIVLPSALIAVGLGDLHHLLRPRRADSRDYEARPLVKCIRAFGCVALFLVILQSATPASIHFDASWSHLTIAEDYAREGRIVPFFGFTPKNLPHLSSVLYTWAFLVPGLGHPALHWLCAQWVELQLLGFTLLGVSTVSAWLLGEKRLQGAWAVFFLFPGFYLYDSNFAGGSDHIAAFFALPMLIAGLRAARTLGIFYCSLTGLFAGALMHTKFQGFGLVFPLAVYLILRWLYYGLRRFVWKPHPTFQPAVSLRVWGYAPLFYALGFVLAFGPHLLSNWIFYKNPVYPLMPEVFTQGPHLEGMTFDPFAIAQAAFTSTVPQALKLMLNFSVSPQYVFGERLPAFGSLFTLLSPIALISFRRPRLFAAVLLSYAALFLWCYTYHIDRNLQVLLPWFAAVTAATLAVAWRSGLVGRFAIVIAVALQVGWGSRFMLVGGHDRMQAFFSILQKNPEGESGPRWDGFRRTYREIGEKLPESALLLLHTAHVHLGINRRTLGDWAGWQHVIDYRPMRNARDVYDVYKKLGITHITWNNYDYPVTRQEDVLFFEFTRHYATKMSSPGDVTLWAMPKEPPPKCGAMHVLLRGLWGYQDGLYPIEALNVFEEAAQGKYPKPSQIANNDADWASGMKEADAVLWVKSEAKFEADADKVLSSLFHHEHTYYSGYGGRRSSIYLRKKGHLRCSTSD